MYAFIVLIVLALVPEVGFAELTLAEASEVTVGEGTFISDPVLIAGVLGFISLASSIVTMGIKSKGWPVWLQPIVDALNYLALNVWKNKNADAVEK